ncbi:MAG TPA: FtsX-like permease family protein [Acidimicrobiales bacterium]|nr:FtsX-like permease family protein [Acidimicrobiales bacterium]
MIPVAVLSLPFLYMLVRRPVLRRLAMRNAVRRPREALLVVLGSLLGTAIITSSFVVGDTLDASFRQAAVTKLGPVDELVRTADAEEQQTLVERLRALDQRSDDIDGVLPLTTASASVAASTGSGEPQRAQPSATVVEADFALARTFGGDEATTGIAGRTPAKGRTALGEDLASRLRVRAGDEVTLWAYGRQRDLVVDQVLPQRGVAGFTEGLGTESLNLFVAPGTLGQLHAQAGVDAVPPSSMVAVSNAGGVFEGASRTEAVVRQIADELGRIPAGLTQVKQEVLDDAEAVGSEFTELFASIGFFSVLAGVLLLVNIFVMLAQERKSELGMLRAVGLRRASLVGSFALEGWVYAFAASTVGALVGIGLGRLVAGVATGIFSAEEAALELSFAAESGSIQTGFTIGFVISLLTLGLTSLWISRVNVIRAIRDLPEPVADRTRARSMVAGAVAVVAGVALSAAGIPGDDPYATMLGPVVLVAGLVPLLNRAVPRRLIVSLASMAVLAWMVMVFGLLPEAFDGADIPVFVVQGVVLTAAAVALVSHNQEAIGAALRRLGRGRSMALRLGLAYPLARRFRTGMILAMYSLVVFTLVFITVLSHLFSNQIDQFTADVSGGFDLQMSSNPSNAVLAEEVVARNDVRAVAGLADMEAEFLTPSTGGGFEDWYVTGIDETFVDQGPTGLAELGDFPDVETAYRAVLADPNLVIVSDFFLQGGGGPPEAALRPGQVITLRDPLSGRTRDLTVAAIAESSFANDAAFVSQASLRELYGSRVVTNRLLIATASGADVEAVASELNATHLANGADAVSFRHLVATNLSAQTSFFRLMQGYLALGLLVGIAGLGVVMVRAVRERRRQVGVLRALGYESSVVRRAFVAESAFVAAEGILIGTLLAITTAFQIVANDTFGDLAFSVPWAPLFLLVGATLAASVLATAAPAQQASRIRPAVALRLAD